MTIKENVNIVKLYLLNKGQANKMSLRKTDLFTFIHKALRSLLYDVCSKLQKADFENYDEAKKIISILEHGLELLHEHAEHEDNIIFPEIVQNEPKMIKILEDEHKQIEQLIREIQVILNHIDNENDNAKRIELGIELTKMFNQFTASYLSHMNHEEATVLHASMKYLSDDELISIRTKIQERIPPERYKIWLNWMLTSLNNSELISLLGGMRIGAPKHIFENVVEIAKSLIEAERWNVIQLKVFEK